MSHWCQKPGHKKQKPEQLPLPVVSEEDTEAEEVTEETIEAEGTSVATKADSNHLTHEQPRVGCSQANPGGVRTDV